jgi:AcrR family transcriptional regulator
LALEPRAKHVGRTSVDVRDRILRGADRLFCRRGVKNVGIDAILIECGVAKATLYRYFHSKDKLVLALLEKREKEWGEQWLNSCVVSGMDPASTLLAMFDAYDKWFRSGRYTGGLFTRIIIETQPGTTLHRAAVQGLAYGVTHIAEIAYKAGLHDPQRFARVWQLLVEGAVIAVYAGNKAAALEAKHAAALLLKSWEKATQSANARNPNPIAPK